MGIEDQVEQTHRDILDRLARRLGLESEEIQRGKRVAVDYYYPTEDGDIAPGAGVVFDRDGSVHSTDHHYQTSQRAARHPLIPLAIDRLHEVAVEGRRSQRRYLVGRVWECARSALPEAIWDWCEDGGTLSALRAEITRAGLPVVLVLISGGEAVDCEEEAVQVIAARPDRDWRKEECYAVTIPDGGEW